MNPHYDVIVTGAGPAGSMTAMILARAGVSVLLLDRALFPRPKPCGDCLSAEASRLLQRHGLLQDVVRIPHALLRGWRIFAPDGRHFAATFQDEGAHPEADAYAFAIERSLFDAVLLNAARSAGADVREGVRVDDVCMDGDSVCGVSAHSLLDVEVMRLTARHVVGADGLRSLVARRLGAVARPPALRKLSLTAHIDGPLPFDDFGEMHVGEGLCAGIAPVRAARDRWNVTVVADSDRYGRVVAHNAASFFRHALETLPGLRGRIAHVVPDGIEMLASGPFDAPMRRIEFNGSSLVGDAAGYFDPFTGQGIYHGMRAAEILAHALIDALHSTPHGAVTAAGYTDASRSLLRGPRRLQKAIDSVLARPAFANRAIARLARAPAAARALIQVTSDVAPVVSLLSASVARSVLFPVKVGTARRVHHV
ncbi:MAG: NAD(P)/FAD-dependent oxidoreductase [Longimicrobiales bacterium]